MFHFRRSLDCWVELHNGTTIWVCLSSMSLMSPLVIPQAREDLAVIPTLSLVAHLSLEAFPSLPCKALQAFQFDKVNICWNISKYLQAK
jgi:hypothetical protein